MSKEAMQKVLFVIAMVVLAFVMVSMADDGSTTTTTATTTTTTSSDTAVELYTAYINETLGFNWTVGQAVTMGQGVCEVLRSAVDERVEPITVAIDLLFVFDQDPIAAGTFLGATPPVLCPDMIPFSDRVGKAAGEFRG